MAQLLVLVWLKWTLFRNSLRSSKATVHHVAQLFGATLALCLAAIVSIGLGFAAYALNHPDLSHALDNAAGREFGGVANSGFIMFSILAFIYLMWATVPLSIGTARQFEVGKMLMYPISLPKLFLFDFVSEIGSLQSVFAIPAICATAIGAGLGSGNLLLSSLGTPPTILFGMALSKWLSTTVGALLSRKRSRGETLVALVGAVVGLGGALLGQLIPVMMRHVPSVRGLRWTPPGAAAVLFMGSDLTSYFLAFITLTLYSVVVIAGTFWIARRAALGLGGKRKRKVTTGTTSDSIYSGWQLPLVSPQLSAIIEKELKYALRNAQLKTLALMPLVILILRFFQSRRFQSDEFRNGFRGVESFFIYASGLTNTGGVLYVFLILAGISCNLFAFEASGMRTLILSPIDRKKILLGKNAVVVLLAFAFSVLLLTINAIIFRDVHAADLLFTALSFIIFAAIISVVGNWLSLSFPKHMKFGKRMNVSGVAGVLLIPLIAVLALPPLLSAFVGYMTGNRLFEYATLSAFAVLSIGLYGLVIGLQGQVLARREIQILEEVKQPVDE